MPKKLDLTEVDGRINTTDSPHIGLYEDTRHKVVSTVTPIDDGFCRRFSSGVRKHLVKQDSN